MARWRFPHAGHCGAHASPRIRHGLRFASVRPALRRGYVGLRGKIYKDIGADLVATRWDSARRLPPAVSSAVGAKCRYQVAVPLPKRQFWTSRGDGLRLPKRDFVSGRRWGPHRRLQPRSFGTPGDPDSSRSRFVSGSEHGGVFIPARARFLYAPGSQYLWYTVGVLELTMLLPCRNLSPLI